MRVFDVGHRARMRIQPFLAKNCVPTPANQKINDDEDPNGEMIDFRVHKVRRIIRASQVRLQENSSAARASSILTLPLFLGVAKANPVNRQISRGTAWKGGTRS